MFTYFCSKFIQEIQISLESPEFCAGYYKKTFWSLFWTHCIQVHNLVANCNNLKHDGEQAVEQCRKDQQMLAELHDKYQLLRQDKGTATATIRICVYYGNDRACCF